MFDGKKKGNRWLQDTAKRLLAVCDTLWFLNHLEALPIQNFTKTRTKQNKQKLLGFSLFLWEASLLGTTSGELIVNLITQGLGFPWKESCFSREKRDILHPKGHPPHVPFIGVSSFAALNSWGSAFFLKGLTNFLSRVLEIKISVILLLKHPPVAFLKRIKIF